MAFSMQLVPRLAMQRHGKQSFTTIDGVFCAWSVQRLYNEIPAITKAVFRYFRVFVCLNVEVQLSSQWKVATASLLCVI
jgi:hypothetical protein